MSVVVSGLLSRAKAFWPMLAGIICARTALIVACYGSYASTDDGIFTDGSMFVTCALFIVALLIFSRSRRELGATAVQWIMVGSIIVAAGASMALSLLDSADQILVATAFALSIANTLALSLCMFYWLRCLRGTDEVTAALFVFSAFFISVGIVYLLSFLPTRAQNIIGMALIVAQFAFLGPAGLRAEHPTDGRTVGRAPSSPSPAATSRTPDSSPPALSAWRFWDSSTAFSAVIPTACPSPSPGARDWPTPCAPC